MSTTIGKHSSIAEHDDNRDAGALVTSPRRRAWRHFLRHFLEMFVVMVAGMVTAATIFMYIVNLTIQRITWEEALVQYPVHALLVIAIGMTLPMLVWMRHRGHSRRSANEMAAAMALPVIPFILLVWFDVIEGAQCGLYCIASIVAMLALMIYRRADYTGMSATA